MTEPGHPPRQGLYDPRHEHDACGIGFVVNIKGTRSNQLVRQALTVLVNLDHRGASGAEANTGDGAGILLQIPHRFLQQACRGLGIVLPDPGQYGTGTVFLPPDRDERHTCERVFEEMVEAEGQELLGWRTVPTDNRYLGTTAKIGEPFVRQVFIGRSPDIADDQAFERRLFRIRRRAAYAIRAAGRPGEERLYVPGLSCRTMVYKGMLTPRQLEEYYPELSDPLMESGLALVHSRFSTNTFPTWKLAHPFRYLIHNGEINTLRGNVNWMRAREMMLATRCFGDDLESVLPVIGDFEGSDSAILDHVLEFLTLGGRSLAHVMMMMIPEPWENHESMSPEKRAFYEYHSCLMEPWDGPASIAFTDGIRVGAVLDRNGLRPSRYCVTKDDLVVLASEAGALELDPGQVLYKGRLQPGRMLMIDTAEGRIVSDEELKQQVATEQPYREWLDENLVRLEDLPEPTVEKRCLDHKLVLQWQQTFGYTFEDLRVFLEPMVRQGRDPVGSMGNDAPLAVLSDRPHLLYNYFKQLFAQVTNPPIDPIREELVTSVETTIGPEHNLLEPRPHSCRHIKLQSPILKNDELAKLRQIQRPGFRAATLPILFSIADGEDGLERAMDALFAAAGQAIDEGSNVLILSDRLVDRDQAPIPALLAVAGLHHHLIRAGARGKVGLVVESGEPREVHHFCLLIGYGAQAINPYMAYESLDDMLRTGMLTGYDLDGAVSRYVKAAVKGVVKVMAKMGISTIKSYRGAQIFEAVGMSPEVIERYFTWTDSRIGGIDLRGIAREALERHGRAFPAIPVDRNALEPGGQFQWRHDGEHHLFNPLTIHKLQAAVRAESYETYREYAALVNDQSVKMATLRSLLDLRWAEAPVPLDQVEPVESICRRFKTGAMSYGSISREAHETLAIAMNRLGGKSNTGEGGEDPARYQPGPNGDSRNSAIKQVASGRFGVTSHYLVSAQELQIKMAQGAKPGEGGELPGPKVYPWIAAVRHSTPGVGLISPPPHHDIYSIEDLAQLIYDLKNANPRARINVKLVSEVGVGTVAAGVAKGHADVVLISGHDGGTGASPQTSIKHAGMPWELGLAETHQALVLNNLRSRIVVETDGQLKTGRDVVVAALLGAEEFGFATTALVSLGCLMMRVCHLDTCPVGVATQNPELRKRFAGKPEHVISFLRFIAQDMREIMARLGFRTIEEMVGRTDRLEPRKTVDHWKAAGLDLSALLHRPRVGPGVSRFHRTAQDHGLKNTMDSQVLLDLCEPALQRGEPVSANLPIRNTHRVVGTMVGSEVTRRFGPDGLPADTIHLRFHGSAGQSFAAFVPPGLTLELEGEANDYFGKGLSGGKLILYPPAASTFKPEESIIVGNVALYGATRGVAYIRGVAGERFCVRNSGAAAVVEGVGDHGCEYMTGGRVVVLGPTGRNFAAGMSGGTAYVLDRSGDFRAHCNTEMVDVEPLAEEEEMDEVRALVLGHAEYTRSELARELLDEWDQTVSRLVRIMPRDYRRMLAALERARNAGLSGDDAVMEAFEENKQDLARLSGN